MDQPDSKMDDAPGSRVTDFERVAVELATMAGAVIVASFRTPQEVTYKSAGDGSRAPVDPVSETDRRIEILLRQRIRELFPHHLVVGEEFPDDGDPTAEWAWVVDPVDGTGNFVNGFPLFASAIGLLHRGRTAVGAVWTSTSHELRAGVYHARRHGPFCFEGHPVPMKATAMRRPLAAASGDAARRMPAWDSRCTGSAAIDCAFVAAGIFQSARLERPRSWDVAAGLALVQATRHEIWAETDGGWAPFEDFRKGGTTLRDWCRSLTIGTRESIRAQLGPAFPEPSPKPRGDDR
jgi:myo-inositol-1(or 4)-monophosphatase